MCCILFLIQSGFSALHIAAHYGNAKAAKQLITGGAVIDFKARVSNS